MRRLDLSPYTVTIKVQDPAAPGNIIDEPKPYDVKGSIVNVLFAGGAEGRVLLKKDAVAQKIEAADDTVLLEDAEFKLIEEAFQAWKRFGRNEVELVRRIEDAERVNLRDVKAEKDDDFPVPKRKSKP